MKYKFLTFLFCLGYSIMAYAQEKPCAPGRYTPAFFNPTLILAGNEPPHLTPPLPSPLVDSMRGIFWVHGLSGNLNSLSQVGAATDEGADGFPARRTQGVYPEYAETSLNAAGNTLAFNAKALTPTLTDFGVIDQSNNFIIAHSQGGLAARRAEIRLDSLPAMARAYYGIVTFNTPHQGAQIINSRNAGLMTEFAQGACASVLTGKALEVLNENSLVDFFVNKNNVANGIDSLCGALASTVLPLALKELFAGASNDYAIGTPAMQKLAAHNNPATRKTAFYGVEYGKGDSTDNGFLSKQLLWRLVSTPPEFVSNSAPFMANPDSNLITFANKATATYWAGYEASTAEMFYWLGKGYPCDDWWDWALHGPLPCLRANQQFKQARDESELYYKSWLWFNNSDAYWKTIIGALAFEAEPIGKCVCDDPHDDDPATSVNTTEANCPTTPFCDWAPVVNQVVRESDGAVLAESAKNFPGASGANRLDFANHLQVRNCERTRTGLLLLFETGAGHDFFKTKKRQ